MRALIVVLWLSLTTGCLVEASSEKTRCSTEEECQGGETCVAGFCETAGAVDAGSLVDAATDASLDAATLTVTSRVAAGADDAEERVDTGTLDLGSSDLELVNASFNDGAETADQITGMRFPGLMVPSGATIVSATIQFTVDEVNSGTTVLVMRGEATDDATGFANVVGEISSRTTTTAFEAWDVPAWETVGDAGDAQRTPDLAPLIQEIVDRPGWSAGGAIAIIVTGAGKRVAVAFNGVTGDVDGAELTVTYQ